MYYSSPSACCSFGDWSEDLKIGSSYSARNWCLLWPRDLWGVFLFREKCVWKLEVLQLRKYPLLFQEVRRNFLRDILRLLKLNISFPSFFPTKLLSWNKFRKEAVSPKIELVLLFLFQGGCPQWGRTEIFSHYVFNLK